ncbi:MAG: hypothetical protein JWN72_1523, partial [Thermoleophilia bacterium]|nr:hypothetical protein [Thermoleophilia bacterium]
MRMPFAILLVATALAAIPGTAFAKNGDRGTTTPPAPTTPAPTTPAPTSPTPTTPTPAAPAAPCLELTARDGGTSPGELRFEAVNCGSSSLTFTSSVTDTAWRVLYPDWSCGTATYAGPKLTVAAGR